MTIQLAPNSARRFGKSKATLQAALNNPETRVAFDDPSMFSPAHGGSFLQTDMDPGEKFAVVMDPDKRMRFATVARKADGTWKVS